MGALNPFVLGWTEFWLRMTVVAFALSVVVLAASIAVKLLLHAIDGVGWVMRRVAGGQSFQNYAR